MQLNYATVEATPQVVEAKTPNRPAVVVEWFVRYIEVGEIESALRLLSERIISDIGFRKLESIFSASSSEIWSAGGIESVDVQTVAFSRDHVEMRLSIWYGDHKVETEMVELVRENGRWKISMEDPGMSAIGRLHGGTVLRTTKKGGVDAPPRANVRTW